eukprot:784609-Rhodomonas_salina.1
MDIITPPMPQPARRSKLAALARSVSGIVTKNDTLQRIKIDNTCKGNTNFVALMGTLQVIAMQRAYVFKSTIQTPEPKNQTEVRKRADAQDWKDSEWVKMDTIYRMGTIVYIKNCDLPKGTTTILIKFTYKCKMGDEGQVGKGALL